MKGKRFKLGMIGFGASLALVIASYTLKLTPLLLAQGDNFSDWRGRPTEPFSQGKAAFHKIIAKLQAEYVDQGLTEDEIYHAAAAGVLDHIGNGHSDPWNKLLTPTEHAELLADLNGEVVGIGVSFRFEDTSGMGVVNEVLPGTPAEAAGLKADDRILQVNGKSFVGKQLRDMVYAIRGRVGTHVTLTILRDAEIFSVSITRAALALDDVESASQDGVGILSLQNFAKKTPQKAAEALIKLREQGIKSLLVDLRQCPGGSFTAAVATASLLLPKGATVVRVKGKGGKEEVMTNKAEPVIKGMPVGVIISEGTSSGCELMAGALRQNINAILIGSRTNGKWSMQTVDELPNHYAMKFTVARFFPPDGSDLSGKGLTPDVPVAGQVSGRAFDLEQKLDVDPVLQAAKRYLKP